MTSLREHWTQFRGRVEREVARRGYSGFVFTLEDNERHGRYPFTVLDRTDTGWANVEFPLGPFAGNSLMPARQDQMTRYRYGTGGRVVVDTLPNYAPSVWARYFRYTNRTVGDRTILDRLGVADQVPDGYSMGIPQVTFNGTRVGWAVPNLLDNVAINRCCSCREVNTHVCCRSGYSSGFSFNCSICNLPRTEVSRNSCRCNGQSATTSNERCSHNWEAVQVDNYSTPAPNGFRSLSAETGAPLWSSSPSSEIPYYLGIEWEVSGDDEQIQRGILQTMHGSPWVNSAGRMPLIVKSDGSVEGEEICFSPMSPGAALAFPWDEMADNLDRSYDEPDGHGVHVHISDTAFGGDEEMLRRWVDLVNINARPMAEHVARRGGSSWARFNGQRAADEYRRALSQNGRYSAINANTHHNTHEVRIFRSADTGDQMRAAIAFVAATVDYVRDGGDHTDMAAFRIWVMGSTYSTHLGEWFPAGFPANPSESAVSAGGMTAAAEAWAAAPETEVSTGSFRLDRNIF